MLRHVPFNGLSGAIFKGAALCAALLAALPVHADLSFPLVRTQDGLFAAEAIVNDNARAHMVVDTGSAMSAIRTDLVDHLALLRDAHQWRTFGLLSVEHLDSVAIDSFDVGAFAHSGTLIVSQMDTLSDPRMKGLIGSDLLFSLSHNNRYLALNFADHLIQAADRRRHIGVASHKNWHPLRNEGSEHGLIVFDVTIDGVPGVAILDTGIKFTLINSKLANALVKRNSQREFTVVKDVHGEDTMLKSTPIRRTVVGDISWRGMQAVMYDSPVFEQLGLAETPTMLVGVNMFEDLNFVIDTEKSRFIVGPPDLLKR